MTAVNRSAGTADSTAVKINTQCDLESRGMNLSVFPVLAYLLLTTSGNFLPFTCSVAIRREGHYSSWCLAANTFPEMQG